MMIFSTQSGLARHHPRPSLKKGCEMKVKKVREITLCEKELGRSLDEMKSVKFPEWRLERVQHVGYVLERIDIVEPVISNQMVIRL